MADKNEIMLASPIGKYLTQEGVKEDFGQAMKEIYSYIENYTDKIAFSLKREEYGKKKMWGDVCTPLDYEDIKNCKYLIAFPEDSCGVAVELGWASAMQKEMLVFVDENHRTSELVKYINLVTSAKVVTINTINGYEAVMPTIKKEIDEFLTKRF